MRWYSPLIVIALVALAAFIYSGVNQPQIPPLTPSPITDSNDSIIVFSPTKDEVISSPLVITGKARGQWFFEASFPVALVNWDGLIIAKGLAEARNDWMTNEYVLFKAELSFVNPAMEQDFTHRGALILKKDNPSGLPANDASLEIPVKFK
jgi:hypothetical protein